MNRSTFTYLLIIAGLICDVSAQGFKKEHEFGIPAGYTIQHNFLKKPKFLPSGLNSRSSMGIVNPDYHPISSDVLRKLKTDISVLQTDELGFPTRFRSSATQINANQSPGAYWSARLLECLRLDKNSGIEYKLKSESTDNLKVTHLKYNQWFDGLPVLDAEYFVHLYDDQSALAHGKVLQPEQSLVANLSVEQAYIQAKNYLESMNIFCVETPAGAASWIRTGLQESILGYWMDPQREEWNLVYQLAIFPNAIKKWIVYVDAVDGSVIKAIASHCMLHNPEENFNVDHSSCPAPPQNAEKTNARDLFDVTRTIDVWRQGSELFFIDASRPMFNAAQFSLNKPVGAIWTIDAKNSNPNNIIWDHIKSSNNTFAKNAVSAHYNAGLAFEYFMNTHTRNSINGKGGTIISIINVSDENGGGLDNAFWNGEAMFYGNGSQAFTSLAKGLDVGGHEMSHGVIQSTANLAYEGESGAINESFADIFGAMIDRNDWKIGEDVVRLSAFPSGALRDMSDPHNGAPTNDFGRWQPRHVNEQYKGNQDNGGVHINSGIPNYAFYLFVQELAVGSNEEQAKKTAEKVYYRTLNHYLTRSSNFKDLRLAVEQACVDLQGNNSSVHNAAKKAFDLVGIGSSSGNNYQKDLPVNPGKEFIVCTDDNNIGVYLGDFASGNFKLISNKILKSKPSVTDNGKEIYYVGNDARLYAHFYNQSTGNYDLFVLDSTPIYRNAVISKDGNLLSVLYEQEENKIHVYLFNPGIWKVFTLTNPTTSSGVETSNVRYADFMDFDHSGQYIMYDCLSKLDRDGGGTYEYWDIGFIRIWDLKTNAFGDGHIEKLFTSLPYNISIGNPVYSKNSPYIMTFDYLEDNLFGKSYAILAANIETGDVGEIAINRSDLGYPSYSVKDDVMLFNGFDANFDESLKIKALATNKIESNGSEQLLVSGARWGNWFADGKRNLVNTRQINGLKNVTVNPNPFSGVIKLNLESSSIQKLHYELFSLMGQSVKQASVDLQYGINQVDLPLQDLSSGLYYLKLKTEDGEAGILLSKVEE